MQPYDDRILSDRERALWCVVPLPEQRLILDQYETDGHGSYTQIKHCPA